MDLCRRFGTADYTSIHYTRNMLTITLAKTHSYIYNTQVRYFSVQTFQTLSWTHLKHARPAYLPFLVSLLPIL